MEFDKKGLHEGQHTFDLSLKATTCKNSRELTNSSKELVYVLPWSTAKIAEISLSYLFTLRWLGTSASSHPVKKLYNSNIFQISALKMKFCTTILALAQVAIACNAANVPIEISPKGFIEELTLEQQHCLVIGNFRFRFRPKFRFRYAFRFRFRFRYSSNFRFKSRFRSITSTASPVFIIPQAVL